MSTFNSASLKHAGLTASLLCLGIIGFCSPVASAQTTGVVGDIGDPVGKLQWLDITCPPGQLAVGLDERQGGWTAQVKLLCAAPNQLGSWSGRPTIGGAAGGYFGNHDTALICPAGQWITGISGQQATAFYATTIVVTENERRFLANPMIYCGNAGNAGLSSLLDIRFKPEKPHGPYPTMYAQTPTQYCATGTVAGAMRVAVSTVHHPDIKAIALRCAPAPTSQVIPRVRIRH